MAVAETVKTAAHSAMSLYPGETDFQVQRMGLRPDGYNLIIRGYLPPGWTGRLASAVAQHGISIVRGEAERTAHLWHSTFELKSAPLAKDPLTIDYITLARNEISSYRTNAPIELNEYLAEESTAHDGSLYVEVKGGDRIGFLGDVLDYFSFKCLFPAKMVVETVGSSVSDKFWLKGVGGSKPSEAACAALRQDLEGLKRLR